jgi:ABC-type ATPase with predicted acetyltransferase domain
MKNIIIIFILFCSLVSAQVCTVTFAGETKTQNGIKMTEPIYFSNDSTIIVWPVDHCAEIIKNHEWINTIYKYQINPDAKVEWGYFETLTDSTYRYVEAVDTRRYVAIQYCKKCGIIRLNIEQETSIKEIENGESHSF